MDVNEREELVALKKDVQYIQKDINDMKIDSEKWRKEMKDGQDEIKGLIEKQNNKFVTWKALGLVLSVLTVTMGVLSYIIRASN